ncbi:MAG: RusA family crossover junction endodeoxyribonuclease [Candidatus Competibacter denitrificans]
MIVLKHEITCETTRKIALDFPLPPSANKIWRRAGDRTVLSVPARRYRDAVAKIVFAERGKQGALAVARTGLYLPLVGRLSVTLALVPAKNNRRDLDNCFKAVLDALTHAGLWRDDAQIDHLSIDRYPPDPQRPHLKVVVTPLESLP